MHTCMYASFARIKKIHVSYIVKLINFFFPLNPLLDLITIIEKKKQIFF